MRTLLAALAVATTALSSGCASIVTGSQQSVSVEARSKGTLVKNATCKLNNNKGAWYVNTPGSVTINRSYEDLTVQCEKEQYEPGVANVKSSTKAMMFGNILFGGIIGGAVDASTGAGYDYPPLIHVEMGQTTTIESPTPAEAKGAAIQTAAVAADPKDSSPVVAKQASALPVGAMWNYKFEDGYGSAHLFSVRLAGASGSMLSELFEVDKRESDSALIDANASRFTSRRLGASRKLVELAPYIVSGHQGAWPSSANTPSGYPSDGSDEPFNTRVVQVAEETVIVPAGSFKALRVEVTGERSIRGAAPLPAVKFRYTVWYAKDIHRYVKAKHQQWNRGGSEISNESVQLVGYTAK